MTDSDTAKEPQTKSSEDTTEDPKFQENENPKEKALDGGYGWFVVLGCFLSHAVTGGLERSDGIFYLQFLTRFGQSAQLTAWPGAIVSTIRLVMGPLASAICNRYSARTSVMIGGILLSVGTILNGIAPNFYFLFFSQGLVAGVARGFAYAPGLILVGMYFDKKRGLASGLAASGVGVGTFVVVPITQVLFDNFGFQGAFLILGGYTLNLLLVAMLYRPLSMTRRLMKAAQNRKRFDDGDNANDIPLSIRNHEDENDKHEISKLSPCQTEQHSASSKLKHRNKSLIASLKICFPIEHKVKDSQASKKLFYFSLLKNPAFFFYCISILLFTMSSKAAFTFIPALVKSKDISETQAALVLSITGVLDSIGRIGSGFLLDLGRVTRYRPKLYNFCMFIVAGLAFVLPSLHTFASFCAICSVYGLFSGAYISQKSVIVVDILDATHLTNSFGILILFQGMGNLLGPPISGALKDYFGSFDEAFYLGGGLMIAAGSLMILSNICLQRLKRRAEKAPAA